jgi:cytoskeletal protein RodZ
MKKQGQRNHQEQAEKLAELGARLQTFRQQRGISLEQITTKTLIPTRLLAAIEAGDLARLPEPVYVQGFIRRYADAIGVDGVEFADRFPREPIIHANRPGWKLKFPQLRPLHLYGIYTLLVMGAVIGLSHLLNRSSSQFVGALNPPSSASQASTRNNLSIEAPSSKPTVPASPPQSNAPTPSKPIQVSVKMTEQSWIRVVADGKTEFEDVLSEGIQRTWLADRQVTVRAGNAGGVLVSLNNGQAKPLGTPGAVEEVTFGKSPRSTQPSELPSQATLKLESVALVDSNVRF